jgi:peroxiredoxin
MVLTPSTMQELGTTAPDFSLPAPDGKLWRLADQPAGKGLLVVFMCNHCPT